MQTRYRRSPPKLPCHQNHGQPMDEDITKLEYELSAMAASIMTTNGGGLHDHIGMIFEDAKYVTFSHNGAPFMIPTNPGQPNHCGCKRCGCERKTGSGKLSRNHRIFNLPWGSAGTSFENWRCCQTWMAQINQESYSWLHPQNAKKNARPSSSWQYGTRQWRRGWPHHEVARTIGGQWESCYKIRKRWKNWEGVVKKGISAQPLICLALAKSAFKTTGQYKVALNNFEAKPIVNIPQLLHIHHQRVQQACQN